MLCVCRSPPDPPDKNVDKKREPAMSVSPPPVKKVNNLMIITRSINFLEIRGGGIVTRYEMCLGSEAQLNNIYQISQLDKICNPIKMILFFFYYI